MNRGRHLSQDRPIQLVTRGQADYLVVGATWCRRHGFRGFPHPQRRRPRGLTGPPPQRRRSLARRLSVRQAASGIRVLWRGLDPAGQRRAQTDGPEAGMHQRATAPEIVAYYARVLESMVASGKVTFHPNSEYLGGRHWTSRLSGQHFAVPDSCRVVNAHYLAPEIPAQPPHPSALQTAYTDPGQRSGQAA
jgi:hypothetical protein